MWDHRTHLWHGCHYPTNSSPNTSLPVQTHVKPHLPPSTRSLPKMVLQLHTCPCLLTHFIALLITDIIPSFHTLLLNLYQVQHSYHYLAKDNINLGFIGAPCKERGGHQWSKGGIRWKVTSCNHFKVWILSIQLYKWDTLLCEEKTEQMNEQLRMWLSKWTVNTIFTSLF